MTGFKSQISGVRSDCFTNYPTTGAKHEFVATLFFWLKRPAEIIKKLTKLETKICRNYMLIEKQDFVFGLSLQCFRLSCWLPFASTSFAKDKWCKTFLLNPPFDRFSWLNIQQINEIDSNEPMIQPTKASGRLSPKIFALVDWYFVCAGCLLFNYYFALNCTQSFYISNPTWTEKVLIVDFWLDV